MSCSESAVILDAIIAVRAHAAEFWSFQADEVPKELVKVSKYLVILGDSCHRSLPRASPHIYSVVDRAYGLGCEAKKFHTIFVVMIPVSESKSGL